ncbi:MAG TPA: hypothetical protein VF316_06130 [Polyangiaceae bacterium]
MSRASLARRVLPVLVALSAASIARAAEPTASDIAAARQLATEGVKLADQNRCDDAVDKLARAEQLYHAPTVLGRLGECQVLLGKLVEGTENLQRVVREPLPASAPPAYVKAHDRAKKMLDVAKPRIAKLIVKVVAPVKTDVEVQLDAELLSSALVGAERPTDPGDHVLVATAVGMKRAEEKFELEEAETKTVTITLVPDPSYKPPAPLVPIAPKEPPKRDRTLAWASLGVGGAGLAVGAIFGGLALGKKGSLDGQCTADKICGPSAQSDLDAAQTFATLSTVGFIVGGVGVAAAVVLFLWPEPKPEAADAKKRVSLRPLIGPGSVGLAGTF